MQIYLSCHEKFQRNFWKVSVFLFTKIDFFVRLDPAQSSESGSNTIPDPKPCFVIHID